ncbi:MAG: FAD-binding protein [Clostridiales Family XIII bacterium]|jgi:succinate dehydrogenase/fumarate reductase flavoprotein subunit|nr:FAD-binding protein [Clostridiales Family XIII bacterium]
MSGIGADYEIKKYATDVLVVGGVIGVLAAAIRAREGGADVIVLEKANTARSGNASSGIDHIQSFIPELHGRVGYTEDDMISDQIASGGDLRSLMRADLIRDFVRRSAKDVISLEQYGLRFRFDDSLLPGGFRIVPQFHSLPTSYHFEGRDIKRAMTNRALGLGVAILNRAHVCELLKDGDAATGAIAIGTRDDAITVVNAKTTILATSGVITRLSHNPTGAFNFELFETPGTGTGSGKVLAAKAGAEVVNLEFFGLGTSYTWLNYSFTVGLPGGSWWPAGRITDEGGNIIVPRSKAFSPDDPKYKTNYRKESERLGAGRGEIVRLLLQGRSLYFDLQEATDEEIAYILWALGHEGKTGVLKRYFEKNAVNLKTARFPLRLSGKSSPFYPGIWVKGTTTETSVRNLYATGNEIGGIGPPLPVAGYALVFGFGTGACASVRAKDAAPPKDVSGPYAEALKNRIADLHANAASGSGENWRDAEWALQALVDNVISKVYTETAVSQAGQMLAQLRESLRLSAGGPHERFRAFEVYELFDLAALLIASIFERKTSIGSFRRLDEEKFESENEGDSIGVFFEKGRIQASRLSNMLRSDAEAE